MYRRPLYPLLIRRLKEPRRFLQVLVGPRQSGKTTLIRQVIETVGIAAHYASADQPTLQGPLWIEQQWEIGRRIDLERFLLSPLEKWISE